MNTAENKDEKKAYLELLNMAVESLGSIQKSIVELGGKNVSKYEANTLAHRADMAKHLILKTLRKYMIHTDEKRINRCNTLASACFKRREKENKLALKVLKQIVVSEKNIELVRFGETLLGNHQPLDYDGAVATYGAKSWENADNKCNIVAMYEHGGTAYGKVSDCYEDIYDYPLDELDFDPVEALKAVTDRLLK